MTARILDGKLLAQKVRDEVRADVAHFVSEFGRPPGLDVVLVGERIPRASCTRATKKKRRMKWGCADVCIVLSAETTEAELLQRVI